jgi:hypothetical protein
MRSYIKLSGPPVLKAIKELEKLAIQMPQVCVMDTIIAERCGKIVSKSGEMLGDHDFFFEWFKNPNQAELNDLIQKIDEALAPLGCRYTITTKR